MVDQQQFENEEMRTQLEQVGNDKITFAREKIDELVHKEVQLKLNLIAQNSNSQDKGNIINLLNLCRGRSNLIEKLN